MPEIEFKKNDVGDLVLPIRSGANFDPVTLPLELLIGQDEVTKYRESGQDSCRRACGNLACDATLSVTVVEPGGRGTGIHVVKSAALHCSSEACPHIDPPSAGDREPRVPNDPSPVLQIVLDRVPVLV